MIQKIKTILYILVVSSFVFSAPVSNDIALQVAQNTFIKYLFKWILFRWIKTRRIKRNGK